MPLPYRTLLLLPPETDLIQMLEHEVEAWIQKRGKVDPERRIGFTNGSFFEPGVHRLSEHHTLLVARRELPESGGRSLLMRLTEVSKAGTWEVEALALDAAVGGKHQDHLLIQSSRVDAVGGDWTAAPPGLVSQLLQREAVFDGATQVTAQARLIRSDEVESVRSAVLDQARSISVIVGVSVGPEYDEGMRSAVSSLTTGLIGVASVFVLTADAASLLNSTLPATHRVEAGLVRTYLPKVQLEDPADGRRHRVLGARTFERAITKRRDGKLQVANYLKDAFATLTRASLLSTPLPSSIRRIREVLLADLGESVLQAKVDDFVEGQREAASEAQNAPKVVSVSDPAARGVLERIRQLVVKWLKRDAPDVTVLDLDEIDTHLERATAVESELRRNSAIASEELSGLNDRHQELVESFGMRGLELAEAEEAANRLGREVQVLRRKLAQVGDSADADIQDFESTWATPRDLSELAITLMADSDHVVTTRVVFTGDPDLVLDAQERDQTGLYTQRCWDFARVLFDYAELRAKDGFAGNVHSYLKSDGHDGMRVPPKRHAPGETEATMTRWGSERVFPVPEAVADSGSVVMSAHFKVDQRDTYAPRLHYYDDTERTGKIYIGYIGRHLTNTKTKNA